MNFYVMCAFDKQLVLILDKCVEIINVRSNISDKVNTVYSNLIEQKHSQTSLFNI